MRAPPAPHGAKLVARRSASALIARSLHKAISDVHDILKSWRFGKLYGLKIDEAANTMAKPHPGHLVAEEPSEVTGRKRLFDPVEGFNDLHLSGIKDPPHCCRPAESCFSGGFGCHRPAAKSVILLLAQDA